MRPNEIPANSREAFFTLAHLCEPADPAINRELVNKSPEQVIQELLTGEIKPASRATFADRFTKFNLRAEIEYTNHIRATYVTRGEVGWPRQLSKLGADEPWVLWSLGAADFRLIASQSLAIVGMRACTNYGQQVAFNWSAEIADSGVTVVSGGAIGVDIAAHKGALSVLSPTLCVLAGGVQARYPASNEHVFHQVMDTGVIISESPPREAPRRQRFLTRNRIIAALTKATLIVEASRRSGTASTASWAESIGRPIFGVPGSVYSAASEGIHHMMAEGRAILVHSPRDLLELVNIQQAQPSNSVTVMDWRSLTQLELDVWESLPKKGHALAADIATRCGISLPSVIAVLTELNVKNMACTDGVSWRRVN